MIDIAQKLEALGVCALATPCVTAHSFHDELQSSVHIPFIHMVRETAAYLKEAGCKKPALWRQPARFAWAYFRPR